MLDLLCTVEGCYTCNHHTGVQKPVSQVRSDCNSKVITDTMLDLLCTIEGCYTCNHHTGVETCLPGKICL